MEQGGVKTLPVWPMLSSRLSNAPADQFYSHLCHLVIYVDNFHK